MLKLIQVNISFIMVQLSFVFKCTSSCCSCSIRGNLLRYWINMWAAASMSQKWRAKSKVRGKKWSFDIFIKVAKGGWKGWYWNMVMSRQAISAFNIYEKWKKKIETCSVWFSILLVHNDMRLLSWKFISKRTSRYTGGFPNHVPFQRWTVCLILYIIQSSNILI